MPDEITQGQLPIDVLRTFVAAAESGNFTRAGERVHRTQSAVSMQMKRLEEDMDARLFTRQGRGMALTGQGQELLDYARRILSLHDEALAAFSRPDIGGMVRFGASESYASQHLPRILAAFSREHPKVRVDLICDTSRVLVQEMRAGNLDLALCVCGDTPDGGRAIHRERVLWVASAHARPEEETPLPLALFHEGCVQRGWALAALHKLGRPFRIAYCSPSTAGIVAAVRSGLAVAPIAASAYFPDCRVLGEAEGLPLLPSTTVTLHGGQDPDDALTHSLARYVIQAFQDLAH
ncbi:LysR substrate-binding domain-containing protein [Desulfocurvus sp. DL9XJH121]